MIKNIGRNGKEIDLTGIELKEQDFPQVYKLIERNNENERNEEKQD